MQKLQKNTLNDLAKIMDSSESPLGAYLFAFSAPAHQRRD
jgi:hypothetical protein